MSNKNGFTLIELTVSIFLMLLLAGLVVSRVVDFDTDAKKEMLETKIGTIKNAAVKYANDHIDDLMSTSNDIKERKCALQVTVNTLIQLKYLKGDDEYDFYLLNPITNERMNGIIVCVGYIDREIVAELKDNVYSE